MKIEKFTIKDIIFIAIIAATLILTGLITMPLVMSTTLFGLRNMVSAPLYGMFTMLGIMKIKKVGTLTLIGLFNGSVLLMMAPVMFWTMILGSFISELITFLIYKGYESNKSRVMASTLFIPFTLPTTLLFTMLIHGKTYTEIIKKPVMSIILCIGTALLSYLGAKIGQKLGRELQKAGKL